MGSLITTPDRLEPWGESELQARQEMSALETLRNASLGEKVSIGPIIAHAKSLVSDGQPERALDILTMAERYRHSFTSHDYDVLRLTTAKTLVVIGESIDAPVKILENLIRDMDTSEAHRTESLLCLGDLLASNGDYWGAACSLEPPGTGKKVAAFDDVNVVLARGTYLNLAGDPSSALRCTEPYLRLAHKLSLDTAIDALTQHAWSLTHLGRFTESNTVLHQVRTAQLGTSGTLNFISAWNAVGLKGISFGQAIKDAFNSSPTEEGESEPDWLGTFFKAYVAFARGRLSDAGEMFDRLHLSEHIEPGLNGTRRELALQGKGHTALALGDYETAYESFRQLADSVPARTEAARFQVLIDASCFAFLATKLNYRSSPKIVSAARRSAQVTLGLDHFVIPLLMDFEADLLLSTGLSTAARTTRMIALELLGREPKKTSKMSLYHQLGLCLVDAYEQNSDSAQTRLRELVPILGQELGWRHEKTLIARHALASIIEQSKPAGTDQSELETVYQELVSALGPGSLSALKSRYEIARSLYTRGDFIGALDIYREIDAKLPDRPQNRSFRIDIQRRIGWSNRELHNYVAAQQAFEAALNLIALSVDSSSGALQEVELDLHECLLKRGMYNPAMAFFSNRASTLRATGQDTGNEYFRVVCGYASCLEHLGDYQGSAHNYGRLLSLLDQGMCSDDDEDRLRIYIASAWSNEQSKNFPDAAEQYKKVLQMLAAMRTAETDTPHRQVADIEHRLRCCSAQMLR